MNRTRRLVRRIWGSETYAAIAVGMACAFIGLACFAIAQASPQSSYYDYSMRVSFTVATSATDANWFPVSTQINTLGLVDAGFLAADGEDILLTVNGTERPPMLHMASTAVNSTLWIPLASASAGATYTATMYIGQNTTAADNPQSLFLSSASTTPDKINVPDDAAIEGSNAQQLALDDFLFTALPTSQTAIWGKGTAYRLLLDTDGTLSIDWAIGAGSCPDGTIFDYPTPLVPDVTYDIVGYVRASGAVCGGGLKVDANEAFSSGSCSSCTLAQNSNAAILQPPAGAAAFVGRARIGNGNVTFTMSTVADYQFEPTEVAETQTGSAANGWEYIGTVADQQGSLDATYTFYRDQSNITVTTGALTPLTSYVASVGDETFTTVVSGNVQDPDPGGNSFDTTGGTYSWPFSIFQGFVGDTSANQMPDSLFSGILLLALSGAVTFGMFGATRMIGMAVIGGCVTAAMVVLMTPLPFVLAVMIAVVAVPALRIIPEPFTAR